MNMNKTDFYFTNIDRKNWFDWEAAKKINWHQQEKILICPCVHRLILVSDISTHPKVSFLMLMFIIL